MSGKYLNKKCTYKKEKFDSQSELNHYLFLLNELRKGKIKNSQRQVKFEILPSQYEKISGKKVCIERPLAYIADFTYVDCKSGEYKVVDVKSSFTAKDKVFLIKKKWFYTKCWGVEKTSQHFCSLSIKKLSIFLNLSIISLRKNLLRGFKICSTIILLLFH